MRRLKKLGVCLSMAIVCAIIMAVPACAKEMFNDVQSTYTEPNVEFDVAYLYSQKEDIYEKCRVKNPDDWYLDDYIKDYAYEYKDNNYVGDLMLLFENKLKRVCADDYNVFTYGIYVTDDPMNPSWHTLVYKCSDKDYKTYINYLKQDESFKQITDNSFEVDTSWGHQTTYYYPNKNFVVEFIAYYN